MIKATYDSDTNFYCGPTALSAVSGYSADVAHRVLIECWPANKASKGVCKESIPLAATLLGLRLIDVPLYCREFFELILNKLPVGVYLVGLAGGHPNVPVGHILALEVRRDSICWVDVGMPDGTVLYKDTYRQLQATSEFLELRTGISEVTAVWRVEKGGSAMTVWSKLIAKLARAVNKYFD